MLRERELNRARPITELALPPRAMNALLRGGVNSVGQLIARSREDLLTGIIGLGEGTLKIIETALAQESLTLATAKIPSSTFTQIPTRRALARAKTSRHTKNHNTWQAPPSIS
ncbi:DNA-directed RNA polymerase subunit alpha C-terminal domain-containing protein [Arthrobacter sp. NQ7]|uniref:DNA-directed RNA polymerase subunit alpha C-terminal domain-containing protein n=1 Tax=Arthrobacter sp. NQ7 TaxID=3032303 RepID=UPI0024109D84|nr:DNA-directed RNA polymerase subunit alpha C-terminal domain-containing protein [Arthrobacter sp. NQ7]MDJ0457055.1 DNA-directed RNA polymerase subunit alpha C-terminal domain-containing protein [Arthrobacter sp. NQ7]